MLLSGLLSIPVLKTTDDGQGPLSGPPENLAAVRYGFWIFEMTYYDKVSSLYRELVHAGSL